MVSVTKTRLTLRQILSINATVGVVLLFVGQTSTATAYRKKTARKHAHSAQRAAPGGRWVFQPVMNAKSAVNIIYQKWVLHVMLVNVAMHIQTIRTQMRNALNVLMQIRNHLATEMAIHA